jgi:hypothetical protein
MKTVFYTLVSDDYYYPIGCHKFVNSFKKFHPDIDLVVFRQDMIDKVFKEKNINFYMAKPTFALLLADKYDLVVNIDCDTAIFGRLDAVLKGNYEVGAAWNYNQYENSSFENIREKDYLQAGLVASTDRDFWRVWEVANKDAMKYLRQENDILNKVVYGDDVKHPRYDLKIFDKDIPDFYGCKSLGQEPTFYVKDDKVWCGKGRVVAYHQARGGRMPKLDFTVPELGFTWEVSNHWENISMGGISVKYATL